MPINTFRHELRALVRKHLAAKPPRFVEDFDPVRETLEQIIEEVALAADAYRFRGETETKFANHVRQHPKLARKAKAAARLFGL